MSSMTRYLLAIAICVLCGCTVNPLERLSEDLTMRSPQTRAKAAQALAQSDSKDAVLLLARQLGAETDEAVLHAIALALVSIGRRHHGEGTSFAKEQRTILYVSDELAKTNLDEINRDKAAWVLGEIGDRDALPYLIAAGTDAAEIALTKLGYYSDGTPFETNEGVGTTKD